MRTIGTVDMVLFVRAVLGMVMLPNPVEPLCPVPVNDRVVTAAERSVDRVTLDICVLETFPLMGKSIVDPSFVFTSTKFGGRVGVGEAVGWGVAV